MFKRILIANRGEIAMRLIRCCREMEIDTVLAYSEADKDSLPVQFATYPVCIGPAKASESYLQQDLLIDVARKMECEAIHPGYGFLSENADFAEKCEQNGIIFIGPSADIIRKMGNKQAARTLMKQNQVPVAPGSDGAVQTLAEAEAVADKIGYPVLVKAAAGGGGRGMRKAFSKEELKSAYETAKAEALSAFGDDEMYLEKLILKPHHIEFQILGDSFGNIIHLGERDCSIQRRNQKMMEESPSKVLSSELRKEMGEAAVRAAKAAGYYSAGTVEFVLDQEKHFYFIEMNTRIQVEHPVTEMVSNVDLVKEQIRVAAGLRLNATQADIVLTGHAIECRINAESPERGFAPTPGTIEFLHLPGGNGVRIETAMYQGYTISPYYDSMVAKIIVHAESRLDAIRKMRVALEEVMVQGIDNNAFFQYLILYHPDYIRGNYDTSFLEEHMGELLEWHKAGVKGER
ncbi:MAG: acetyl-CoA carboxylase biotin carboxylase subunit [Lachnospiraceae bacterium]|nr:acetyl-CoA carboxylase biotin carboxylase subunit [Lachnospiraceae bacterium]